MNDPTESPSRDELALRRTRLANERTLLAYARTAVMLAASGVTLLKIAEPASGDRLLAWTLVGAAAVVGAIGVVRYRRVDVGL